MNNNEAINFKLAKYNLYNYFNLEYIIEKESTKDEEERLSKCLDTKSLDAIKFSSRSYKKQEGVFTRLFRYDIRYKC